jgi:oxygen-independent coproporphyrinogen-3 oxidase
VAVEKMALYLHVPFCSVRCGYCDFNTYTAEELARDGVSTSRSAYLQQALVELDMARAAVGPVAVDSIFIGGGTPTLLPPDAFGRFISTVGEHFALKPDAEITIEANPDTLSREVLDGLLDAGITRLSIGMQSAVPHVLAVLDRTHDPENVSRAVQDARAAGFRHVSVDLIYGSPGESLVDWQRSLDAVMELPVDHVSAYALIVEEGTRLARQVARGESVLPDDDETAEKYLMADAAFAARGLEWYEVSNWSEPAGECRHNLAYWESANWWGIGPGAHSHVEGVRWWNVKHPAAYAARIAERRSPGHEREVLSAEARAFEEILLRVRLREGIACATLSPEQGERAERMAGRGLLDRGERAWVLTLEGRLLADAVVRELLD